MEDLKQLYKLDHSINSFESFNYAKKCADLLNSSDENERIISRNAIISYLDRKHWFPDETISIWNDLIEAAGFYPYIDKNKITYNSLSDNVRINSYDSENIENIKLHSEQKKIYNLLISGKNVVVSAPTSFGKSMLIEELVASKRYHNIVIIQPTLALLDETRVKLKKYAEDYKIIVRTTQQPSTNQRNLFLLTAERVIEYDFFPDIDLFIIDEFYKLSLKREDGRVVTLNNAFLKITNRFNPQIYMMGPNIMGISKEFEEKYNAVFYKSSFSMVENRYIDETEEFDKELKPKDLEKLKQKKLFELLDSLEDPTLVYCSSPSRARRYLRDYILHLKAIGTNPTINVSLINWLEENISEKWTLTQGLKYGISVHDGSLQKHVANSIISYFNSNKIKVLFCTSTIIEGVNTCAKNVIIFDLKKGNKKLDYFDFRNIEGRSGRLMEHYIGNVYSFIPTPPKNELNVDIPFVEQKTDVLPDEILLNIKRNDIKHDLLERYDSYQIYDSSLMEIIKNNGESIKGQLSIYNDLLNDISDSRKFDYISWSNYPNYNSLAYLMNLCEGRLFDFNDRNAVFSSKQLVFFLDLYSRTKSIIDIKNVFLNTRVENLKNDITAEKEIIYEDDSIEKAFHVYRHWFMFKVPKALRVIDSLQRYICINNDKKPGSYSFYVEQLENDFVPSRLSILMEYGLPRTTINKLENQIPDNLDEDQVLSYVKLRKNELIPLLDTYERERLLAQL